MPMYILFPTSDELKEVVKGFNFPQCAGSTDGSHISVTPPFMSHTDYYNRKGFYSVIVQAVVDHNCLFSVGWPGSVNDARVFANSVLYRKVSDGEILQGNNLQFHGSEIQVYLYF